MQLIRWCHTIQTMDVISQWEVWMVKYNINVMLGCLFVDFFSLCLGFFHTMAALLVL